MTRQPHIPPADWSPRTARDLLQLGNDSTNGVVARLLELRGISDNLTSSFFHPSLEELHDPSEMRHMDRAVDRIMTAQRNGECIMAYGDYDVDGATSVSLIHDFLRNNGFEVLPYIPDRYSEGYGLSSQGVQRAAESGCSIIITLDCGIRATERVAEANALGIDVIICDHHLPGETLPEAFAILNPKHPECQYPFKELSGCGVAFKLTQGLTERIGLSPMSAYDGLDLVALSIASDLVEVTGENRILLAPWSQGHFKECPTWHPSAAASGALLSRIPHRSGHHFSNQSAHQCSWAHVTRYRSCGTVDREKR